MNDVLPFMRRGQLGGLVYVTPSEVPGDRPDEHEWLIYSQPEDATEPDLETLRHGLDEAVATGRQLAIRRGARVVVDYGVMSGEVTP